MKVLSFKVPSSLDRKLNAAVKRRGVKKSTLVREALAHYLVAAPEVRRGSALELAGDLVGCLKGGPPDLSSNPRYLDDFGK